MDKAQLKWFGHMARMPQDTVNKKIYQEEISGRRNQGRLRKKGVDGVQEILSRHGLTTTKNVRKARLKETSLRNANVECLDMVSWRAIWRSLQWE